MVLDSDGTLRDDRDPVAIAGIRQEDMAVSVDDLRKAGTKVNIAKTADEIASNAVHGTEIERIEYLVNHGWYSAERGEQLKKQLKSRIDQAEISEKKGRISIEMVYNQPNISVSSSGRFKEHQTIDGPVVRQKVGEGNVELEVEGVCTTEEAKVIDSLRFEGTVTILSNRYSGEVQVASTSTDPLEDGGAMNLDGQFTHSYGISCVQVE